MNCVFLIINQYTFEYTTNQNILSHSIVTIKLKTDQIKSPNHAYNQNHADNIFTLVKQITHAGYFKTFTTTSSKLVGMQGKYIWKVDTRKG